MKPSPEMEEEFKELERTFGTAHNLGNPTNPDDYPPYPTKDDEKIDATIRKIYAEQALERILAAIVDAYPMKPTGRVARLKIKDIKADRIDQAMKHLVGKKLSRGRSTSKLEQQALLAARIYWLAYLFLDLEHVQRYPSLDSILHAVVLTDDQKTNLSAKEKDALIKHHRRYFKDNMDRLLRQVSTPDLRSETDENKTIDEILKRLAHLGIIPRGHS